MEIRKKFNDKDFDQITTDNFWFGRMWADYEKYTCTVMISFDTNGPKLDLCTLNPI